MQSAAAAAAAEPRNYSSINLVQTLGLSDGIPNSVNLNFCPLLKGAEGGRRHIFRPTGNACVICGGIRSRRNWDNHGWTSHSRRCAGLVISQNHFVVCAWRLHYLFFSLSLVRVAGVMQSCGEAKSLESSVSQVQRRGVEVGGGRGKNNQHQRQKKRKKTGFTSKKKEIKDWSCEG